MEKRSLSNYGVNFSIVSFTRAMINVQLRTESRRAQIFLVRELLEREAALVRQSQQRNNNVFYVFAIISAALSFELSKQTTLPQARFNLKILFSQTVIQLLSVILFDNLTTTRNRSGAMSEMGFSYSSSRSL